MSMRSLMAIAERAVAAASNARPSTLVNVASGASSNRPPTISEPIIRMLSHHSFAVFHGVVVEKLRCSTPDGPLNTTGSKRYTTRPPVGYSFLLCQLENASTYAACGEPPDPLNLRTLLLVASIRFAVHDVSSPLTVMYIASGSVTPFSG